MQVRDDDELLKLEGFDVGHDDDRLRHLLSIYKSTKVYLPAQLSANMFVICKNMSLWHFIIIFSTSNINA